MTYLQTNSLVKIRFPSSLTKGYWAIEEKSSKTIFAAPSLAVLITIACAKPVTKDLLFKTMLERGLGTPDRLEKALEGLISKNIISFAETSNLGNSTTAKWKKAGWDHAADYHFFTWDAPFLDYSKEGGGHERDRSNMLKYQKAGADVQRCKVYEEFFRRTDLPSPLNFATSLEASNFSLSERVKLLLSLAFGKKGEKACHWSDAPLMRRTSPSGGSRHPTEGYFISHMPGIATGWHHVQADPPYLVHLCDSAEEHSSVEVAGQSKLGTIILTSVFERNMYRYREPRTFRTIHMDVGHILETIEMLGRELGIETQVQLDFDEQAVLKKIGASKLQEGVMAVVTLREGR